MIEHFQQWGTGAEGMPTNVVNLDALIPRETFDVDAPRIEIDHDSKISISKLNDTFFGGSLRKPDFQRETYHWSPAKVVDLIRSFLDGELIPAVILWQSGPYVFVVDGAHRLSALLDWINDDYGDKSGSQKYFDYRVPDEQIRIADRTRKMVAKDVGTYDSYLSAKGRAIIDVEEDMRPRLARLNSNSLVAQWVLSSNPKVAEDSFFKINQAASPIDPTERRIIKARGSANAMAARAISRAGGGHRYWKHLQGEVQASIEDSGKALYKALYNPPMDEGYVRSTDVLVAGRGYNPLPFVFDLVNLANKQKITDSTAKTPIKETLPSDPDGTITVSYLARVKRVVGLLTGHDSRSLGLHPLVYFYSKTGSFQPVAFFAVVQLVEELEANNKLKAFTAVRGQFEDYLITHRDGISVILHRMGSGNRSLSRMKAYFERVLEGLWSGVTASQIQEGFAGEKEWEFLTYGRGPGAHDESENGGRFNRNTKSAAVISQGRLTAAKCPLCGGYIHKNSMHIDHDDPVNDGGRSDLSNAQVTHPYCDSIKSHLKI